jgi:hypothetical protein
VALKVVQGIYAGVTTRELDKLAAEICACLASPSPVVAAAACVVVVRHSSRGRARAGYCLHRSTRSRHHACQSSRRHATVPGTLAPLRAAGAYSSTYHPDWSVLAARIAVSDLHKMTDGSFAANAKKLHEHVHPKTGAPAPLIADDVAEVIANNAARLDAAIDYNRDFE